MKKRWSVKLGNWYLRAGEAASGSRWGYRHEAFKTEHKNVADALLIGVRVHAPGAMLVAFVPRPETAKNGV